MSSHKQIQISSKLDIDSEVLHEKTVDNDTGETKETYRQEPHSSTTTTTVTTNPVQYEAKGIDELHVTQGKAFDVNPALSEYDTSQL
jgi:hypothetical protein